MTVLVISVVVATVYGINNYVVTYHCEGTYPNPKIGGCGIYSTYDLDIKWCEENGGRVFDGGLFSSSNCVFPRSR